MKRLPSIRRTNRSEVPQTGFKARQHPFPARSQPVAFRRFECAILTRSQGQKTTFLGGNAYTNSKKISSCLDADLPAARGKALESIGLRSTTQKRRLQAVGRRAGFVLF